ncbi:hypothetical protein [Winogradskyella forsetii]|uniref:hypothetical protein n=1 Tax=Winogradskyella forsetii TaxID=2686077 RepID=UPI0015BC4EDA|nr:hypothetical protein [Winogradskyella forsetii]
MKIDTIYTSEGNLHKIINYNPNSESDYYDLALKCKTKADSLLKARFDLEFFNEKIVLDVADSGWYTFDKKSVQLFELKNKKPKTIELVYSILEKNSNLFNLIEVTIECIDELKIVDSIGIPETKNYNINIDYNKALALANKKGYRENRDSENYEKYSSDIGTLSLEFTREKTYRWVIHKNIKMNYGKELGKCSTLTINSKALFIDAESGKTKSKKIKTFRSVYWY